MTHIVSHVALSGATEGLDGKHFSLLHLGLVATLDDRHALAAVDDILVDVVSVEVSDRLHWIRGAVDFDLVAFHRLLDGSADVTHTDVDTSFLHRISQGLLHTTADGGNTYTNASISGILDSLQERVEDWVKGHGEGAVDNASIDMDAKVDLHHVSLLQHHLVPCVGRVVRRAVVDTQTTGEAHATQKVVPLLKALVAGQGPNALLDALRDLGQSLAGLDGLARILADLTVDLRSLAVLLQEVVVHPVKVALLLVGRTVGIVVLVLDDLSFGKLVVGEEGGERDPWGFGLGLRASLLLLWLALLLLLCRC